MSCSNASHSGQMIYRCCDTSCPCEVPTYFADSYCSCSDLGDNVVMNVTLCSVLQPLNGIINLTRANAIYATLFPTVDCVSGTITQNNGSTFVAVIESGKIISQTDALQNGSILVDGNHCNPDIFVGSIN
uniref:Uncharacterized protein n=1 Tax=viral metagenome TaxID=1070528 RepID=A0A6C0JTR9_9ZZZZ